MKRTLYINDTQHTFTRPESVIRAMMAVTAFGREDVPRGAIAWVDATYPSEYDNSPMFWCPVMLCNGTWSWAPWFIGAFNYVARGTQARIDGGAMECLIQCGEQVEAWLSTAGIPQDVRPVLMEMARTMRQFMECDHSEHALAYTMRNQMMGQVYAGNMNIDPKRAKKLAPHALKYTGEL